MKKHLLLVIIAILILTNLTAQIIPPDRHINWTPGLPNGIPSVEAPLVNVLVHGADPTGQTDSYKAFMQAAATLPASGGVVFVPQGTYRLDSTLTVNRDNMILRGEGIEKSRILSYADGRCVVVEKYNRGEWQNLVKGYDLHSIRVSVEDGKQFTVGEFVEIQQSNDSSIMYTRQFWEQPWSENSVGQVLEIVSIDDNELTFRTSLHFSFDSAQNPVIRPLSMVRGVGFEDFYIEKMVANDHTFEFKNAAYCWMKNIQSYHTRRSHVHTSIVLGIEIRDCFMHRSFDYGGGGSGYGIDCHYHSTDCLIENCVFDSLRHAMLVQVGANGNVFGYNYSTNPVQGDGETDLNQSWFPPDISIHGHYPYMNLFEGNQVYEIGIGDWWGPAGPGNTYFRNRIIDEGIIYYDHSHYQNVIGNITTLIDPTDQSSLYKLEHGNVIDGETHWNDTISEHDLPASYYLDTKPAFLLDYAWPTFGPDVNEEHNLSAYKRYHSWLKKKSQTNPPNSQTPK